MFKENANVLKTTQDIGERINGYGNLVYFDEISILNDIYKKNKGLFNQNQFFEFKRYLEEAFFILIKKDNAEKYSEIIKKCFEISCYILYDREILREVIEKQKSYQTEYVVDFFKYMLRMFFNRYNSRYILSKNQCNDIKELCKNILKVKKNSEQYLYMVDRTTAKDIVKCLQLITRKIKQ